MTAEDFLEKAMEHTPDEIFTVFCLAWLKGHSAAATLAAEALKRKGWGLSLDQDGKACIVPWEQGLPSTGAKGGM